MGLISFCWVITENSGFDYRLKGIGSEKDFLRKTIQADIYRT